MRGVARRGKRWRTRSLIWVWVGDGVGRTGIEVVVFSTEARREVEFFLVAAEGG